jgi:TonB family protein
VSLLTKGLSAWKFAPASTQAGPIAAVGKVLFIKGKDYFRYKVSGAFRDSGSVSAFEQDSVSHPTASAPGTTTTVRVPIKVDLEPEAAQKQLVYQVPPQYPAEARTAGVQGNVSLMVTIGKDGLVTDVKTIAGPPPLISAAVTAVRQWRYKPILFKGEPQVASTVVDIPFKLFE